MGYVESSYRKIMCNYSMENIDDNNIGYSFGVTEDGVPFDAEAWQDEAGNLMVTFYLPELLDEEDFSEDDAPKPVSEDMQVFHNQEQFIGEQALCVGMVENGAMESWELLANYVDFLIESDLVEFQTDMLNGSGIFLTDIMGNPVVAITITLMMNENVVAATDLEFIPFKTNDDDKRSKFRVIK